MASYLSRLIERAGGDPKPENRADAIMPAPESVDSTPTTYDPFEEAAVDALQPHDAEKSSAEALDPSPPPETPPLPQLPVTDVQPPDTVVIDGSPLPPPTEPPTPLAPVSETDTETIDGLPERILIERWQEGEPPSIDLPPPTVIEREVIIAPTEDDDDLPISDLPIPPAPETRSPEPIDLPPPEPDADLPPPIVTERPDSALTPPESPPIEALDAGSDAGTSITIGDVIVEIVATKRQPEPARQNAPRPGTVCARNDALASARADLPAVSAR